MKTMLRNGRLRPRQPKLPGRLEQGESADDIGLDEGLRADNGSVHVRLSREMHDGIDMVAPQQLVDQGPVADVALDKSVAGSEERFSGN